MGSLMRVRIATADASGAQNAAEAAFARVEQLNRVCSDYLPDSELIRLCQAQEMVVSDDLLRVLERAREIAAATGGAFDFTCGHYSQMWRRARRKGALPGPDQLASVRALTGWEKVKIDAAAHRVSLAQPRMQLDLGGIAKGFAADAALQVLRERGFPCSVVAASGDLAIGDPPPGARGWPVQLRTFEATGEKDRLITLELRNCGVSTSGDLHQWMEIAGQRYSHIVDPATGLGLTGRIACSVVAPDATTSDATATALCVLGVAKARSVVTAMRGVAARFVQMDGDETRATTIGSFPDAVKAP